MDDEQLRRELERRSQAASFRAEDLLPEVRRWTQGGVAKPARFARWAPLAGLAAAAVIAVVVIIALPRFVASPGVSMTPSPSAANQASPAPSVAETIELPSVTLNAEHVCSDTMLLNDLSGHVVSCADAGVLDYHQARQDVSVTPGSPTVLHITWGQSYCTRSHRISVTTAPGTKPTYEIRVGPSSFDPGCMDAPEVWSANIQFEQPVDPADVSLVVDSGIVQCALSSDLGPHEGQVAIYDGADVVSSCAQTRAQANDGANASTEAESANEIRVRWTDEVGPSYVPMTLNKVDEHYELASSNWCNSCSNGPFEMVITFTQPIDPASLWVGLDGQAVRPPPTPTPSPTPGVAYVDCDRTPGSTEPIRYEIVDETGLVIRCQETPYPVQATGQISVSNPIDSLLMQVAWTAPCDAAITFTFSWRTDAYSLVGEPGSVCEPNAPTTGLWIYLRAPVPAAYVEPSFTSNRWPSPAPSTRFH
jgi:hypothetical protein